MWGGAGEVKAGPRSPPLRGQSLRHLGRVLAEASSPSLLVGGTAEEYVPSCG